MFYVTVFGGGSTSCVTVKYNGSGVAQWASRYNDVALAASMSYGPDADDLPENVCVAGRTSTGGPFDYMTIRYAQSFPTTLVIVTPWLEAGYLGTPYGKALWAFGGSGTRTWSVISGSLPPGLTLDRASGLISGTPTTSAFTVPVRSGP